MVKKRKTDSELKFWNKNPCGGNYDSAPNDWFEWYSAAEPWAEREFSNFSYEKKNVLEVGVGQGFMQILLKKIWPENSYTGIDISDESIKLAKKNFNYFKMKNIDLHVMNAEKLNFSDSTFDFVFSIGVIHHTRDTQKAFEEICRVTKGKFYLMVYSSGNPKAFFSKTLRFLSHCIDLVYDRKNVIHKRLSKKNSGAGTALLELFGVPYMRMYNKRSVYHLVRRAERNLSIKINYRTKSIEPGFRRMFQIFGTSSFMKMGDRLDKLMYHRWGFYRIIEGEVIKK